jgi:hypothetical protein
MTTGLALLLAAVAPSCAYQVTAGPGARELRVEARFDGPPTGALSIDDGFEGFVEDLQQEVGGAWKPRSLEGSAAAEGRVRYRFRLGDAARSARQAHSAFEHGGALLAPPSVWLARPLGGPRGRSCRLRVATPAGVEFVTGLFPSGDGDGFEVDLDSMREAPYSGFGRFRRLGADVGGARLELAVAPGTLGLADDALLSWLEASGRAVAGYYGRFPVPRVQVLVIPGGRRAMGYGTTLAGGGASILLWIGAKAGPKDLEDDWVLVHEMVHLGFPTVPRGQRWLEEGLATYVEPIARVAVGTMTPDAAWKSMLEGLPRGLPRGRAGGLDGASSIDSLYWGGALFFFLADIEIRERSGNTRGLQDALRGILAAGGNATAEWGAREALAKGDAAVGSTVLADLFDRMAREPARVDLRAILDRLGVSLKGGAVAYDDTRPLSAIRRSILPVTPRP